MVTEAIVGVFTSVGLFVLGLFDNTVMAWIGVDFQAIPSDAVSWGTVLGSYLGLMSDWVDITTFGLAAIVVLGGLSVRVVRVLIEVITRIIPAW